jgi:hypothetical protein
MQATRSATALPPPVANAPIFYIGRFLMSNATHGKPTAQFPLSSPLDEVFARNANLWFKTHAELLANIDALTHAWLTRRREGIDAMREAIQQMTECQDATEMLGIQQEWLSGALRRTGEDIASLSDGVASMTQRRRPSSSRRRGKRPSRCFPPAGTCSRPRATSRTSRREPPERQPVAAR